MLQDPVFPSDWRLRRTCRVPVRNCLNLFAFCTKNLDIFLDPLAWLFTKPSSVFLWHVLGLGKKIDEAVETKGGHVVRPRRCEGSALPATQKAAQTKEHQCVHPTPCKAPSAATRKPLETKGRQEPPEPVQSRKCCPFLAKAAETDARAYIRRETCGTPATQNLTRKSAETKVRQQTSDPLQSSKCCAPQQMLRSKFGTPEHRINPLQSSSVVPATQK